MSISVTCSECDKKLKVKEEAAGKKVRCPGCSGLIVVPKSAELELDDLEDYDDEEDDFVSRQPAKKRRKAAVDELEDFGGDELGDDLPTIKPSKQGGKKGKTKAKRASSGDFLTEFYEGQLSTYLAYAFWAIFGILSLMSISGPYMATVFSFTMIGIVAIRGLIATYWWAKICARDSSLGPMAYVLFFLLGIPGLIYGAMNNETCERPNRVFMFSVGIIALTVVSALVALAIGVGVFGIGP